MVDIKKTGYYNLFIRQIRNSYNSGRSHRSLKGGMAMLDSSSLKNILKNIRQVRAVILGDISIKAVWKQGLIDDGS